MTTYRRYAVYWAPPDGSDFARFGAAWLGWDPQARRAVGHPDVHGLPLPVAQITARPRRYGFHATLKAPFRPDEGVTLEDLHAEAVRLAGSVAPFQAPALRLARIGRFVALVPSAACDALQEFSGRCVEDLHDCAAEPSEAELMRRRAAGLTPRQDQLLYRWGYPYVFDEFRFHLTLTGALAPEHIDPAFEALTGLTAPFRAAPLAIGEFCLFGEDESRLFHVIGRYPLTG